MRSSCLAILVGALPRSAAAGIIIAGRTWIADDLAWTVTETPRPAWVRGVVREALGITPRQREASAFGTDATTTKVTTRFVLDLTAISDGKRWHKASGRAIVIVTGDRSEIRAGQAIEATGQLAKIAGPLNPGEFDYRAFLRAQGIRLRLTVDDPASFWRDPATERLGRSAAAGLDPGLEPGAAGRAARPVDRAAGRGASCWASARRSSPRSTTPSRGPARPTCWRSRDCTCRCWPSRSCSCFASLACPAGRLIWASAWRWSAMPCWSGRPRRSCGRPS